MDWKIGQRAKAVRCGRCNCDCVYHGREGFVTGFGCVNQKEHNEYHAAGFAFDCDVAVLFDGDSESTCCSFPCIVPLDSPKEFRVMRESEKELA